MAADAQHDALAAALHSAKHQLRVRSRTFEHKERAWVKAAEKALAGDPQDLRLRVEMYHAEPEEAVLSTPPQPLGV